MKVFILCAGYYKNFDKPKALTEINGERLVDRTIRLLKPYNVAPIITCNEEETLFDEYEHINTKQTFDHVERKGYYLDAFIPCDEQCIYLFGDVYYTKQAIDSIINVFNNTKHNIFICNKYPFNDNEDRVGEPFGWIVKDQEEFRAAITICKKLQDRERVKQNDKLRISTNWELSQVINGNGINNFKFKKEDCLIIDDLTIDVDDPSVIERIENERKDND